jgi:hypothetical protein
VVRGLNVFRGRFAGFEDRYVLIGGAAVEWAMDAAGLQFRVTKDLDIESPRVSRRLHRLRGWSHEQKNALPTGSA